MKTKKSKQGGAPPQFSRLELSGKRILPILILIALLGASELAFRPIKSLISTSNAAARSIQSESFPKHRGQLGTRLRLFPEPSQMRRLLGKRFLQTGREIMGLSGTVTVGRAQQQSIQIQRRLDNNGETVSILLGGGNGVLSWDRKAGPRVNSEAATGSDRELIERIVFDSPDYFILGQLGTANYQTIGREVRPEEAGSRQDYDGPTWDIVRLTDLTGRHKDSAEQAMRMYYINSKTGLIDRIVSREPEGAVVADLADWNMIRGELTPASVVWRRNEQVVMQINYNSIGYSAKQ